jgi:hypothetical protein
LTALTTANCVWDLRTITDTPAPDASGAVDTLLAQIVGEAGGLMSLTSGSEICRPAAPAGD